ncbi:phosphate ABC transporter substrate-binding protein PstS [Amnibacterium kyonggiense]|uniref:Phosphate-binding protein n=1 Tax=Amnibacterium kyonggiense TaxID=595671 RepID=A0A4R7FRE3_9MICO|nr:phosphate ABC transporter substrate-binding protein PstS [Amnibacterium kyonggiense]TDS80380.1 phosphate ABC transporter substrate-binding protein (PhoT family) [Amnibacterium kyonggiense]
MKHLRAGLAIGTALTAMIALSSCASNEPAATSSNGGSSSGAASLNGTLNGVGSSAQSNAQTAWAKGFQTANSSVTVNYDPQGSGAGRTAFEGGGADFAGSDSALPAAELSGDFKLCKAGTKGIDIPVYVSPIAIVYNLDGVKSLNLDASVLAKIFTGKIKKWNDSAIADLNKGTTLPSTAITPVYRSDKSGTSANFTDYMHQAAPSDWTAEAADLFPTGIGSGAAKGSGIVAAVTGGKGTIGYVDDSSVGSLSVAKIKVGDSYVAPSAEVASKSAETSPLDTSRTGNDVVVKINRTTTDSAEYPITLVSYLIACQQYQDSSRANLVKAYAEYVTSTDGQQAAADTAKSAPMTGTLLSKAQAAAASIK